MNRFVFVALAILVTLVAVSLASAQSGELDLVWFTIGGGGASSTGDGYALSGTIGQPDAEGLSGGIYTVKGGFWGMPAAPDVLSSEVYLPLIQK